MGDEKQLCRSDVQVLSTRLPKFHGRAWLVKIADEFFAVSAVELPFGYGNETMVFPCDERGEVTDWTEVARLRAWDHEAAIADLVDFVAKREVA
jgi:hypothetical protein